jgi:hypothetical protein
MDLNKGMSETAAEHMPSEAEIAACRWLTGEQLSVYAGEFARTGFQGGLQWYRCLTGKYVNELETFSGRTIDVPACFIAGKSDWGVYQVPGALERMETTACTQWRGTHLVDGRRTLGSAGAVRDGQSFVAAVHRRIARRPARRNCVGVRPNAARDHVQHCTCYFVRSARSHQGQGTPRRFQPNARPL